MNPDVEQLRAYNFGMQWTHLGVRGTSYWHDRPALCGRTYPNRSTLVTSDVSAVDCPSCLRAASPEVTVKENDERK